MERSRESSFATVDRLAGRADRPRQIDTDGYEILARLLDCKMASLMTLETQRILFGSLGIHSDKPE